MCMGPFEKLYVHYKTFPSPTKMVLYSYQFIEWCMTDFSSLYVDLQTHQFVKRSEAEDVDIGQWVCRIMNIEPPSWSLWAGSGDGSWTRTQWMRRSGLSSTEGAIVCMRVCVRVWTSTHCYAVILAIRLVAKHICVHIAVVFGDFVRKGFVWCINFFFFPRKTSRFMDLTVNCRTLEGSSVYTFSILLPMDRAQKLQCWLYRMLQVFRY